MKVNLTKVKKITSKERRNNYNKYTYRLPLLVSLVMSLVFLVTILRRNSPSVLRGWPFYRCCRLSVTTCDESLVCPSPGSHWISTTDFILSYLFLQSSKRRSPNVSVIRFFNFFIRKTMKLLHYRQRKKYQRTTNPILRFNELDFPSIHTKRVFIRVEEWLLMWLHKILDS